MSEKKHLPSKWEWLENPDSTFELYRAERKAFYDWQAVTMEWSKATRGLDSKKRKLPKKKRNALKVLKKRLNKAATAYGVAKNRLHQAWSA